MPVKLRAQKSSNWVKCQINWYRTLFILKSPRCYYSALCCNTLTRLSMYVYAPGAISSSLEYIVYAPGVLSRSRIIKKWKEHRKSFWLNLYSSETSANICNRKMYTFKIYMSPFESQLVCRKTFFFSYSKIIFLKCGIHETSIF